MEHQLIEKTDELIKQIIEDGIDGNNLEPLYKLTKIKHIVKEGDKMNYGNYYDDRYSNYGRGDYRGYNDYGRRERDSRGRFRGDDYMDRMREEYGRYQESRQRYGASDTETDKSFHYMVKALEDFIMVLHEEAETPQQKQQLTQALQNSMR